MNCYDDVKALIYIQFISFSLSLPTIFERTFHFNTFRAVDFHLLPGYIGDYSVFHEGYKSVLLFISLMFPCLCSIIIVFAYQPVFRNPSISVC